MKSGIERNSRFLSYAVVAVALVGVVALLLGSMPAAAQQGAEAAARNAAAAAKPTPRLANGHPDFSGFYNGIVQLGDPEEEDGGHVVRKGDDGSVFFSYGGANTGGQSGLNGADAGISTPGQYPPYKPEYLAQHKKIAATVYGWVPRLDPTFDCKPSGPTRAGGAMHIFHGATGLALLYENSPGPQFRMIYTDGRPHPADYDTSFMGHSTGRWEGDTLVVDTVGLNDETWLGAALTATIHSDKMHLVERWTRKGDLISVQSTVEDPVMFTQPWVRPASNRTIGSTTDYLQPQACNTNDKAHIIEPSATDKYECNWCQKDPDAVYGQGASANPSTPGVIKK